MRTDAEKLDSLRSILSYQLATYREFSALEKAGEIDDSYIYDCAGDWFDDCSRSVYRDILAILDER